MAALIGGSPELVTVQFSAEATWIAPAGVTMLDSLSGKGQDGTPASAGEYGYDKYATDTYYPPSNGTPVVTGPYFVARYANVPSNEIPADYCEGVMYQDGSRDETCYTHSAYNDSLPGSTGANSSAFGYTFPGGVGGPASTLTYGNITVTPGASYSIIVPAGGSVTITYYK